MTGKANLIIIGAGGHGRVIADAAQEAALWESIAFLDDRYPEVQSSGPWPVAGKLRDMAGFRERFADAAIGIGDNLSRLRILAELGELGFSLPVIAHPTAAISRHAKLGEGSVVFAQAVVNIGASIGMGCIVNTGANIDHDCVLGNGVHVSPGASLAGGVTVGAGSWIGLGSSIRQKIVLGEHVIIGAGSVVIRNLPDGVTAVGVPARIVKS